MQSELKPCPFCGGAGIFENASGSYGYYPAKMRVRCSDKGCSGQTGWFQHGELDYDKTPVAKGKATTAWNTRASDAEITGLRKIVSAFNNGMPPMTTKDAAAEITRLTEALRAAEEEKKALREAVERLRSGYADAVSGYSYILTQHGRLEGVGFDRVMDHYHDWVAMPEREGLLAGSHTLAGSKP